MNVADCASYGRHLSIDNLQKLLGDSNWMVSVHATNALYSYGDAGRRILQMIAEQKQKFQAAPWPSLPKKKAPKISNILNR